MSNLDNLNIKGLTKEAEAGNGCGIKEDLGKLFWEERMAALKMIVAENAMNRAKDPSVTQLNFHSSIGTTRARTPGMDLHHGSARFGPGPVIYVETLNLDDATHKSTCTTLKF